MKLGTSLRFLYPTGPQTYERFKQALAALPPGGFIANSANTSCLSRTHGDMKPHASHEVCATGGHWRYALGRL